MIGKHCWHPIAVMGVVDMFGQKEVVSILFILYVFKQTQKMKRLWPTFVPVTFQTYWEQAYVMGVIVIGKHICQYYLRTSIHTLWPPVPRTRARLRLSRHKVSSFSSSAKEWFEHIFLLISEFVWLRGHLYITLGHRGGWLVQKMAIFPYFM